MNVAVKRQEEEEKRVGTGRLWSPSVREGGDCTRRNLFQYVLLGKELVGVEVLDLFNGWTLDQEPEQRRVKKPGFFVVCFLKLMLYMFVLTVYRDCGLSNNKVFSGDDDSIPVAGSLPLNVQLQWTLFWALRYQPATVPTPAENGNEILLKINCNPSNCKHPRRRFKDDSPHSTVCYACLYVCRRHTSEGEKENCIMELLFYFTSNLVLIK